MEQPLSSRRRVFGSRRRRCCPLGQDVTRKPCVFCSIGPIQAPGCLSGTGSELFLERIASFKAFLEPRYPGQECLDIFVGQNEFSGSAVLPRVEARSSLALLCLRSGAFQRIRSPCLVLLHAAHMFSNVSMCSVP